MNAAQLAPSAAASSSHESTQSLLDRAVSEVRANATAFARLPVAEKARIVRSMIPATLAVAEEWVRAGCAAKGIEFDTPPSAEEWLAGPTVTLRNLRLLAEALEAIAAHGKPPLGAGSRTRPDGRLEIDVFPASPLDGAMFSGFSAKTWLLPGIDVAKARELQASFFSKRDPEGKVCVVLGAGNVSSIPPTDVLYKMFVEGYVCVLKVNPVNEWIGPILERAMAPLISAGWLRVAYGGAEVGKYLVEHPQVDDVHITGSDKTHDTIVWGPPGPERDRRKAENDPILKKTISSELGNVSPVIVTPGPYTDAELHFQARSVVAAVANNASFNCNAAKMVVTSAAWPQRETFMRLIAQELGKVPTRKAYYPGARERWEALTAGKEPTKLGRPAEGELPWTLLRGLDPASSSERLFQLEPFCSILSEVALPEADAPAFLAAATRFANERLWGTLAATIVIHPTTEADPAGAAALDRALADLRYGAIGINHWPALCFAFINTPWGAHPSGTLADIKSGLGWVHNSFLLEGIEKAIVRGPLKAFPTPAWFADNRTAYRLGPKLVQMEAAPSWLKLPGIVATALGG